MSWKGDVAKSGGVATNIGIHFFDMLTMIFGDVQKNVIHHIDEKNAAGFLFLEKARVRWFLSLDQNTIPEEILKAGQRTYRSISIEGEEIEFSGGFTELHTLSYQKILAGNGFSVEDARTSINIVYDIRNASTVALKERISPIY